MCVRCNPRSDASVGDVCKLRYLMEPNCTLDLHGN